MKQFVALARVSSREQEREGFSLEVQEDALRSFAIQDGGEIVRFFRLAVNDYIGTEVARQGKCLMLASLCQRGITGP